MKNLDNFVAELCEELEKLGEPPSEEERLALRKLLASAIVISFTTAIDACHGLLKQPTHSVTYEGACVECMDAIKAEMDKVL